MNTESALAFVLGHDIFLAWLAYLLAAIVAYLLLLWPLRAVRPFWLQFMLRGTAAAMLFTPAMVQIAEMNLMVPAWFTALYGTLQKADEVVQGSFMALGIGFAVALLVALIQAWLTHRQVARLTQKRRQTLAERREARVTPSVSI